MARRPVSVYDQGMSFFQKFNQFLLNPWVSLALGLLMIWVGLQDLGVVPGMRGERTSFSTLLGVAFIGLGVYNIFIGVRQLRKR